MKLIQGDALEELRKMPDASVHACITDPPYFIHRMGKEWDGNKLRGAKKSAVIGGGLPAGQKFDPRQGRKFQTFMEEVSSEVMRVLKPGGFYIVFSQPRLYHHLAIAVEDCGFEIRDMMGWRYEGQAKAFSNDHFVRRKKHLSDQVKHRIIAGMQGRKTPQLKPQIEPMVLAQKPKEGTFVENWLRHGVGLIDVTQRLNGKFPGQIVEVPKPTARERGVGTDHPTVKPVALIAHLIKLCTTQGQTVLDLFMGSGSHGIAAVETGRIFVGIEREPHYFEMSERRIDDALPCRVKEPRPSRPRFKEYQLAEIFR